MSILRLAGMSEEEEEDKVELTSPPPSKGSADKWGTAEEKYRRLCMLALLCRYAYYHHSKSLIPDEQYDLLEKLILRVESANRDLIHPRSPTLKVGSTKEGDYPRSILDLWYFHKDDDRTFAPLQRSIEWFMSDAERSFFDVSKVDRDLNAARNLEQLSTRSSRGSNACGDGVRPKRRLRPKQRRSSTKQESTLVVSQEITKV